MKLKAVWVSLICAFSVACSEVALEAKNLAAYSQATSNVKFCTTDAADINSYLKFLFVMDRSTSNDYRIVDGQTLPGSDQDGTRRFDAIVDFVTNYTADEYVYWGMINFDSTAQKVYSFDNDKDAFASYVQEHRDCLSISPEPAFCRNEHKDGGGTNYVNALQEVKDMVEADVILEKQKDLPINEVTTSNYVIFYISDGAPYVVVGDQLVLQDWVTQIRPKLQSVMDIRDENKDYVDSIQLNTAIYYPPLQGDPTQNDVDQNAVDLLRNMAEVGQGDFLEFGQGQNIDFNRFSIPKRSSRFQLREFFVHNVNSVWDGDRMLADADGDSLSNELEMQLGSNPTRADSDGNGVSDGVEYAISGRTQVCLTPNCDINNTLYYTSCTAVQNSQGVGHYDDSDGDFLNDCEEKLLGSDHKNPDTNQDFIPDHLAFANGLRMSESFQDAFSDTDRDGMMNIEEVRFNTPTRVPNSQVAGLKKMKFSMQISEGENRDCYNVGVENLTVTSTQDNVRIYILENTESFGEKRIFRAIEAAVDYNGYVNVDLR